jgi:TolB protein
MSRQALRLRLAAVAACLAATVAHAQLQIPDVEGPEAPRIPIAIAGFPPLLAQRGGKDLAGEALQILTDDLNNSAIFDVLDPSFLPFEPRQLAPADERAALPGLQALRLQAFTTGELFFRRGDLILEGRLYDVATARPVGEAKRYIAEPGLLRAMVHRWVDEIVFRLTGERGIAQSRISYVSVREGGAREIYVMDYDGHGPAMATANRSTNLSPRWSPDGKSIAYTSYRDGNPDLWVVNLETGRRVKLSSEPGLNIAPAWSPDGRWLALAMSKDGGTNLYLVRQDGSQLRRLTSGTSISVSPTFSPDGRRIAFASDRGGTPQIYVMEADGSNVRRLTFGGDYNVSPRWSPRGERIAFVGRRQGRLHIFTMTPDGSDVRQLTSGNANHEDPTWSPDGRQVAFASNRDGKRAIYAILANGSRVRKLTRDGFESYLPDWSP